MECTVYATPMVFRRILFVWNGAIRNHIVQVNRGGIACAAEITKKYYSIVLPTLSGEKQPWEEYAVAGLLLSNLTLCSYGRSRTTPSSSR